MNTGTSSPTIRQVTVQGQTVTIIDMTTGNVTEHHDNQPDLDIAMEKLLLSLSVLHPPLLLPRRRIPWTRPQHWVHKLVHPDFPYCRGKLAATCTTLRWLVKAKPARAEPQPFEPDGHRG